MDKIKVNDKIKRLEKIAEISKSIISKIQAMPDVQDLKFDPDIILYVCNVIENNIKQNEVKSIDKKKIVIDILQKCHPFTPPELIILNKMIEFLHSNHLIKVISMVEKNGSKLLNWMIKKIAWISYKEIYKAAKEQIITEILIHLSLKKSIVLLIIAFI